VPGSFRQPVLHLIACDTEPVQELEPFIRACQEFGWDVHAIANTLHGGILDRKALAEVTGHPVRDDDERDPIHPLPPAGAYAVAPASFELINKWAYGNNEGIALRLLNDATGLGLPIVVVPAPTPALARHPAFLESIARLRAWGVIVEFDSSRYPLPGADSSEAPDNRASWEAAARVIARWTRFARIPAPGTVEAGRQEELLADNELHELPEERIDLLLTPQRLPTVTLAR
jgi:hypothetical protein